MKKHNDAAKMKEYNDAVEMKKYNDAVEMSNKICERDERFKALYEPDAIARYQNQRLPDDFGEISDEELIKRLAERLKVLKTRNNTSNGEIGEVAKISRETVRKLLQGKIKQVDSQYINKFSERFDVSIYCLLGLEDEGVPLGKVFETGFDPLKSLSNTECIDFDNAIKWRQINPELFGLVYNLFETATEPRRKEAIWFLKHELEKDPNPCSSSK